MFTMRADLSKRHSPARPPFLAILAHFFGLRADVFRPRDELHENVNRSIAGGFAAIKLRKNSNGGAGAPIAKCRQIVAAARN